MTADTAIERFDALFPNALPYGEKLNMLSVLDGRIYKEILSRYEGARTEFIGYAEGIPGSTVLLVRYPYDEIYIKYLAAETDIINGDTARYANSRAAFNNLYEEFAAAYNRTHRIKSRVGIKFGRGVG